MKPRRRLWVRGLLGIGVVLFLLPIGLFLGLQTPWGLRLLADQVESILDGVLVGKVEIGGIEGWLPTHLILHEVVLTDAADRAAITAQRTEVKLAWRPLLDRRLEASEVSIDAPLVWVVVKDGEANLGGLVAPTEPNPTETSSAAPWTIRVGAIHLEDGRFLLHADGSTLSVDRIKVRARAELVGTTLDGVLEHLEAHLEDPPLEVIARGAVAGDVTRHLEVTNFQATIDGRSRVKDGRLALGLDPVTLDGAAELFVDREAWQRILGVPGLQAEVAVQASLLHRGSVTPWQFGVKGLIGGQAVVASATTTHNFSSLAVRLLAKDLNPAVLFEQAPPGELDLEVVGTFGDLRPETMSGQVKLTTTGRIQPLAQVAAQPFDLLLSAVADTGRVQAQAQVDSGPSTVRLDAALRPSPFQLEDLQAWIQVPDLAAASLGLAPIQGSLSATVGAEGDLRALRARVVTDLHGLVWGEGDGPGAGLREAVIRADGDFELQLERNALTRAGVELAVDGYRGGFGGPIDGRGRLTLVGRTMTASITAGSTAAGQVAVWLEGRAPAQTFDVAAWRRLGLGAITRLDAELRGIRLEEVLPPSTSLSGRADGSIDGTAGLAKVDVQVLVRELRQPQLPGPIEVRLDASILESQSRAWVVLAIGDQPLTSVTLELQAGSQAISQHPTEVLRQADAELRFEVSQLPLAILNQLSPADPALVQERAKPDRLGGELTLRGQLDRLQGKTAGQVLGFAKDIHWLEGAPPITATIAASLDGQVLGLDVEATAHRFGGVTLNAQGQAPVDLYDPAAWQALGLRTIQEIRLVTTTLDLATLDRLSGRRFPLQGTVNAELVGAAGLTSIEGQVALRGLGLRARPKFGDVQLYLVAGAEQTEVELGVFRADRPVLVASASVAIGTADLGQLQQKFDTEELQARATLEVLPLEALTEALGLGIPVQGTISATAAFAGTLARYDAHLHLDAGKVRVRGQSFEQFLVDVNLDPEQLSAQAKATATEGGELMFRGELGLPGEDTPVNAKLQAEALRIDFLSALLVGQDFVGGISGVLDADLSLVGTRARPIAKGKATVANFGLALSPPVPPIEASQLVATLDGEQLVLTLEGRSGDGKISARAEAQAEGIDRGKATITLETVEVPLSLGPRLAVLDSKVRTTIALGDELTVDVLVEEAGIEVPNGSSDTLRDIGAFEDVVYLDEERREDLMGDARPAKQLPVNITIKTQEKIPIRGREIDALVGADLRFTQKSGALESAGRLSIEDGWIVLFGRRWEIRRADLAFGGSDEPEIALEIGRDLGTAIATVRVSGTPSKPELSLSSNPAIYDEGQLLLFLLGADPGAESTASVQDRASGAAASALAGALQTRIQDALPLDTINVEIEDGAAVSRVSVGKWLTQRIFVGYDHVFDAEEDENTSEGVLQFRLGRGWIMESRYGDRGEGGLDVIWVRRF